jgi:SH3-like domain-containing protein
MGRAALALSALLAAGAAQALEYRSVAEAAVLYDAPSHQAARLFVVRPGTPVEVIVTAAGWVKVRDTAGDIAWIEAKALADKRTVIVTASRAEIRQKPDVAAPLLFEADKDVVLELEEAGPAGWARVRHRDGQAGYVRLNQIWGL